MHRETQGERTIQCRFSPTEPGQYLVNVRWSGEHAPGSPFAVDIVESQEELQALLKDRGLEPLANASMWRAEI